MADAFISYSHKDSDYAHQLADELRRQNIDVWIDERIDYGDQWPRVIQENLNASRIFLLVMSTNAFNSMWVQNEVSYAQANNKPIFPLLLEGQVWLSMSAMQYMDVQGGKMPTERFFERLREELGKPIVTPRKKPSRARIAAIVSISLVFLSTLAGVLYYALKPEPTNNLLPIIEAASILEPKTPINEVEVLDTREEGDFKYIQEKHNVIENRESVLFLGLNDDMLFPGAIIQGKDVYDFVYSPILVARSPITLSLSLEGVSTTGKSIKVTVDDPSRLSNVRQGINDLLKSAIEPNTRVPAKFDYVSKQVYSSEERNLALGVSDSYADVSVNNDFNWKSEEYNNKILSIYKQVYYTVDMDLPPAPYDLFDPSAGVEGLAAAMPAGSMPMYVSSVSYGWMALLFIETNFSKEEMDTALSVAYDPTGDVEAKLDFGYSTKEVLESSKIQIIVYGGSTAGITSSTLTGYGGLMELIQGSKDFGPDSPGIPLSYKLRHLSNNLIAKIALTEEYTVTKAVRLREFIKINAGNFTCQMANDATGPLDMDRFFFWVQVYQGDNLILDQMILNWQTSGEYDMSSGSVWTPSGNASTVVLLDLRRFDPGAYKIVLTAWARDYDGSDAASDWATGSHTISGNQIYNLPKDMFMIEEPENMVFSVGFSIERATFEECLTYPACKVILDQWNVTPTP